MGTPSALEVCRTELFTKVEDLQQKYPQTLVDKVVRVREMYNWFLSNPGGTDREFVSEVMQRHSVSKVTAYSDLAVVKTLMPLLASASRDFHRWRFNEMIMKTYAKAQAKGGTPVYGTLVQQGRRSRAALIQCHRCHLLRTL